MPGLMLGELLDRVYQICGHDVAPTAQIEQMLNECQDEISRVTRAPTQEVKVSGITGPFTVRNAAGEDIAEYNGILEVHSGAPDGVGLGERVQLLTTTEASRYHPRWRTQLRGGGSSGYPKIKYVIYDPVNITAPLVPMPGGFGSTDLFVKVHLRPTRMVRMTDYPLNGQMANSHSALYHYVSFLLLNQRASSEMDLQMAQMQYARYNTLLDAMISDARPEPVFVERETANWGDWGDF